MGLVTQRAGPLWLGGAIINTVTHLVQNLSGIAKDFSAVPPQPAIGSQTKVERIVNLVPSLIPADYHAISEIVLR